MKSELEKLIDLKVSDRKIQIIIGIATIVLAPFTVCASFFLLAITHAISTIYWMLKDNAPRTNGRKIIEPINLAVILLFIEGEIIANTLFQSGDGAVYLIMMLLCIGPILGISYFFVTLDEIKLLKQIRVDNNLQTSE